MDQIMKKSIGCFLLTIILFSLICGCTDSKDTNLNNKNLSENILLIDEQVLINPIASGENNVFYKGTLKNIGEEKLDEIEIIVTFYDENNTSLFTKSTVVSDVDKGESKDFKVVVKSSNQYFDRIDHVDYQFFT
jgi:hypothetical protein